MNQYITGSMIKTLREKNHLTQAELAEQLAVSDKTISKWETGKGYPDITLLEPIAAAFHISVTELLAGTAIANNNLSANMLRSHFYVCPICGNVIHSMGEAAVSCHGILLQPEEPAEADEMHPLTIEQVEDEYYVSLDHEMSKQHYISFIAALTPDRLQLVKLYPEGSADARFNVRSVEKLVFYCNRGGLFSTKITRKKPASKNRV